MELVPFSFQSEVFGSRSVTFLFSFFKGFKSSMKKLVNLSFESAIYVYLPDARGCTLSIEIRAFYEDVCDKNGRICKAMEC